MDSFEWNKIAGGVLASALLILGINTIGHSVFETEPLEENAYFVEGVEEEATAVAAAPEEQGPSMAVLLTAASPEDGERVFRRCGSCHTATQGEPHRTGPNLYNTVGASVASHDGFNYSQALQDHPGEWTFAQLDAYLENPREHIPGNKMAFAGLKDPEDRAAVMVFLNAHTGNPLPLPAPEEKETPEEPVGEGEDEVPAPAAASQGDQELETDEATDLED